MNLSRDSQHSSPRTTFEVGGNYGRYVSLRGLERFVVVRRSTPPRLWSCLHCIEAIVGLSQCSDLPRHTRQSRLYSVGHAFALSARALRIGAFWTAYQDACDNLNLVRNRFGYSILDALLCGAYSIMEHISFWGGDEYITERFSTHKTMQLMKHVCTRQIPPAWFLSSNWLGFFAHKVYAPTCSVATSDLVEVLHMIVSGNVHTFYYTDPCVINLRAWTTNVLDTNNVAIHGSVFVNLQISCKFFLLKADGRPGRFCDRRLKSTRQETGEECTKRSNSPRSVSNPFS